MDSPEKSKYIYKVGSTVSGEVLSCETEWIADYGYFYCSIILKTESPFKATLGFETANVKEIPSAGDLLKAIVFFYREDILHLKPYPKDPEEARTYEEFYASTENEFKEGTIVTGKITRIEPFGVFVDLSRRFLGLIGFVGQGKPLPTSFRQTMKIGDDIRCVVGWFDFGRLQIRLYWLPLEE